MLAAIAEAVTGPKPGMVIKRRALSSPRAIAAIVRSLRAISWSRTCRLTHERGERRAHAGRNCLVAFRFDDPRQFAGVFGPLRRDDPNLGQMPAKRVDQLRALRHQHFARQAPPGSPACARRQSASKALSPLRRSQQRRPRHSSACACLDGARLSRVILRRCV